MGISWDEFYKEEAPVKKEEKIAEPRVAEVSEEVKQAVEAPVQTETAQKSMKVGASGLHKISDLKTCNGETSMDLRFILPEYHQLN